MKNTFIGKIASLFVMVLVMILGVSETAHSKTRKLIFYVGDSNSATYNTPSVANGVGGVGTGWWDSATAGTTGSGIRYGIGTVYWRNTTWTNRYVTAAECNGTEFTINYSNLRIQIKPNTSHIIKRVKTQIVSSKNTPGAPDPSNWIDSTFVQDAENTLTFNYKSSSKYNQNMYVYVYYEPSITAYNYYSDVFPDVPVNSAYTACWKLVSIAKPATPGGSTAGSYVTNSNIAFTPPTVDTNLPTPLLYSGFNYPYDTVDNDPAANVTTLINYPNNTKFWYRLADPGGTDNGCELEGISFKNVDLSLTPSSGTLNYISSSTDNTGSGDYTPPPASSAIGSAIALFKFRHKGFYISTVVDSAATYPACGTSTSDNIVPAGQSYYDAGSSQPFFISKNTGCAIQKVEVQYQTFDTGTGNFSNSGSRIDVTSTLVNDTYTFTNLAHHAQLIVSYIPVSSTTTATASYCQLPAFMGGTTPTKPNVLLIFDTSGSMGDLAYKTKTYTCKATGSFSALDLCSNFYGYFDKTKNYTLTSGVWIPSTAATDFSAKIGTVGISGNYLNYKNMQKVDIIRKILIGGLVDDMNGLPRPPTASNGETKYVLQAQNNTLIEFGTSEPKGLIHDVYDKVNFGIMAFNSNLQNVAPALTDSDGGQIVSVTMPNVSPYNGLDFDAKLGAPLDVLIAGAESSDTNPNGNTPLAESLYEAIRYYEGVDSAYNKNDDGTVTNYSTSISDPVLSNCQKHFVIILTDGQPTNDANVPTNSGANVTDTAFTSWFNGLTAAGLPTPTSLLARVAYYAHNNDLRSATVGRSGHAFANTQNLNIYTVYAFGDGSGTATLQETAKYGSYFNEFDAPSSSSGLTTNKKPDAGEYNNGYYEATDGDMLEKQLNLALSNIMISTASGTAAAVANNKSGERGANMIQALFYPQWPNDSRIKWLGEMQALWYYLDPVINYSGIYEDSDGNKELNLLVDKTLPSNSFTTKSLWRAGAQLQKMDAANRNIYTPLTSSVITDTSNAFKNDKLSTLRPLMNLGVATDAGAITDAQAGYLVNYIRGVDRSEYRSRKVSFTDPVTSILNTTLPTEWKLGDIINSTPQVQSSIALNAYDKAYSDSSYSAFINSNQYKARNYVYSSSNDGMMHAFRLGVVTNINSGSEPNRVASIAGTDMGKEEWAFIPKQALPYLQNQASSEYCHQCLVDGAPALVDASIFKPSTATCTNYWDCVRSTSITSTGNIDTSSWGTVLVSGMGLGGASRDYAGNCNETLNHDSNLTNNVDCVKSPKAGIGMSSYFALDVSYNTLNTTTPPTTPTPKFMWEFSDYSVADSADKGLGFTSAGTAIVRINAKDADGTPNKTKNGRWFAVFASGPTGAIDQGSQQFTGRSDQNLKIYIVDLNATMPFTKGTNYWVKDTLIPFAFANSLSNSVVDLDRWDSTKTGYYSDDVVYVTYTKASLASGYPTAWDKGGVTRLVTNNDPDPTNWFVSSLIGDANDVGPITSSIGKLQDRDRNKLWVYFGEGRYFFSGDEVNTPRKFYGVQDPCYKQYSVSAQSAMATTAGACTAVSMAELQDQGGTPPAVTLTTGKKGWYINMDTAASGGTVGAERVVSDVTAATNGIIFYTTFTPNSDVCTPGGSTSLWAVKYDTGGTPPAGSLVGKAPVQTSSGGITLIDLATKFTDKSGRKLDANIHADGTSLMGMASGKGVRPLLSNKGLKRILHIQER